MNQKEVRKINKFTVFGWNKILRVKLSFLRLDNARLRKERNKAQRQLLELRFTKEDKGEHKGRKQK